MKREGISKEFLLENKKQEEELKKKTIMKEIELKTQKKLFDVIQSGEITNPITEKSEEKLQHSQDILQSIMGVGEKEFREKMNRGMTYGEMREMYG
jgi:ribosomal protein L9